MKFWLYQVTIALDQLLNALLGGFADETMSARAYRTEQKGKIWGKALRPTIDLLALLFNDRDHCRKAAESESNGKQRPQ